MDHLKHRRCFFQLILGIAFSFLFLTVTVIDSKPSYYDQALLSFYQQDFKSTESYLRKLDGQDLDRNYIYSPILRFSIAVSNKDVETAIQEFNKLQFINDLPEEYKLYFLAQIFILKNDFEKVSSIIRDIQSISWPTPYFVLELRCQLIEQYIDLKEFSLANDLISKLLIFGKESIIFPKLLRYRVELALIQKNHELALWNYGAFIKEFPELDKDKRLFNRLQSQFSQTLSVYDCLMSFDNHMDYLKNLHSAKFYRKMKTHIKPLFNIYSQPREQAEIYYYQGLSHFSLYQLAPASLAFFKSYLYHPSDKSNYKYCRSLESFAQLEGKDAKIEYQTFLKSATNPYFIRKTYYRLCKIYDKEDSYTMFKYYYTLLKNKFPKSLEFKKLSWNELYKEIQRNPSRSNIKTFLRNSQQFQRLQSVYKSIFGSSSLRKGVTRIPLSYYSDSLLDNYFTSIPDEKFPQETVNFYKHLYKLGLGDLLLEQLAYEQSNQQYNATMNTYIRSWILYQQGNFKDAIKLVNSYLSSKDSDRFKDVPKVLIKQLYPRLYWNTIKKYSRKYNVDPYFILAIMREESLFDSKAKSRSGAMGLMQLMPATAKDLFVKLGLRYSSKEEFYTESKNIQCGIYYISWLSKMFKGNHHYILAGYNAGPGRMRKWRAKYGYQSLDKFLKRLPYAETRGYIRRINNSYIIYKSIYSK